MPLIRLHSQLRAKNVRQEEKGPVRLQPGQCWLIQQVQLGQVHSGDFGGLLFSALPGTARGTRQKMDTGNDALQNSTGSTESHLHFEYLVVELARDQMMHDDIISLKQSEGPTEK